MSTSVTMPQLGESVTEGTITRWLKQVGDTVAVDEPLLEISTDKVDTEIPSPAAGVLTQIHANEDDTVEIGGALATIGGGEDGAGEDGAGEDSGANPAPADAQPVQTDKPAPARQPESAAAPNTAAPTTASTTTASQTTAATPQPHSAQQPVPRSQTAASAPVPATDEATASN
ncbi:MAG: biotin/lipoyl-containing protein, partial [Mycobacteriales bacterium]